MMRHFLEGFCIKYVKKPLDIDVALNEVINFIKIKSLFDKDNVKETA